MEFLASLLMLVPNVALADQACPDIYRCQAFDQTYSVEADGISLEDAQDQALDLFSETRSPQNVKFSCRQIQRDLTWVGCLER